MSRALDDWQATWNPRARWKDTRDYLAYRGDVVSKTLELVAVWRRQKAEISSLSKNLGFLCSRLELLVEECGADDRLPEIGQPDVEALARELGDLLSILPETDCWDRHPPVATPGEPEPAICDGCPLIGPVKGLSGDQRYYGCDTLAFFGWKIVDHRAGLPREAWPEPGAWYSAFESNRTRH